MSNQTAFPVDPMAAFFAAVTAVENGSVGEIELEFRFMTGEHEVVMMMSVRKEVRSYPSLETIEKSKEN